MHISLLFCLVLDLGIVGSALVPDHVIDERSPVVVRDVEELVRDHG